MYLEPEIDIRHSGVQCSITYRAQHLPGVWSIAAVQYKKLLSVVVRMNVGASEVPVSSWRQTEDNKNDPQQQFVESHAHLVLFSCECWCVFAYDSIVVGRGRI